MKREEKLPCYEFYDLNITSDLIKQNVGASQSNLPPTQLLFLGEGPLLGVQLQKGAPI